MTIFDERIKAGKSWIKLISFFTFLVALLLEDRSLQSRVCD
jgi:hypothetical protein